MRWLSLVGSAALVGSVAYVYCANHGAAMPVPLSTTSYCMVLFAVYVSGMVPPTPLLPRAFFRGNVFALLYRLYCTKTIGYYLLRHILHQSTPYPHSDYRLGVRCLSDCGLPVRRALPTSSPATTAAPATSAAAAIAGLMATAAAAAADPMSFYSCGGGVIDMTQLNDVQLPPRCGGVLVVPVPMFTDNYAYLIVSLATHAVVAVDPADARAVLRALQALRKYTGWPLVLTDVLTTHKHWDHAGGNAELAALARVAAATTAATAKTDATAADDSTAATHRDDDDDDDRDTSTPTETTMTATRTLVAPDLVIVGSHGDAPLACTRLVHERDGVFAAARGGVMVQMLDVPGHTSGSVMFVVGDAAAAAATDAADDDDDDGSSASVVSRQRVAVFTGDSLFVGGCGAPFETTSLAQVTQTRARFLRDPLTRTHPATRAVLACEDVLLYVGHEYAERLLSEVHRSMQAHARTRGCPVGCLRYMDNVARALAEVRGLRGASKGVADVAADMTLPPSLSSSAWPVCFTLPVCTVPTTLAREVCINPLLTLSDDALDELRRAAERDGDGVDVQALEHAIFASSARTAQAWPVRAHHATSTTTTHPPLTDGQDRVQHTTRQP